MGKSFFPHKKSDLVLWLTNYKTKLPNYSVQFGISQADVNNEIVMSSSIIDAINLVNTNKALLNSAIANRDLLINTLGFKIREEIARHKKSKLYTSAIGNDLMIIGSPKEFNATTYLPKISVFLFGGIIRIKFVKKGVEGINLYKRQKGQTQWQLLTRITRSPFDYEPELLIENQPEHYEFRAFGVIRDKEIGLSSDIVEIFYGK